jgi:hypothetical protein
MECVPESPTDELEEYVEPVFRYQSVGTHVGLSWEDDKAFFHVWGNGDFEASEIDALIEQLQKAKEYLDSQKY